jgi:ferrous iron transport protein B
MQQVVVETDPLKRSLVTEKLDNILLHRKAGYVILLFVLFLLFQCVDWLATYPMDWIEWFFNVCNNQLLQWLPTHWLTDLLVNGVLSGLSGIFVFVPQIMILFGLITALEDSGYMARISFLTDKLMRKVGLNGKSVMPMISGLACAVPAILSARSIENRKERLLTILVTPLKWRTDIKSWRSPDVSFGEPIFRSWGWYACWQAGLRNHSAGRCDHERGNEEGN